MPNEVTEFSLNSGFSARVNGASVADLVQMYCQTRARAAIEVRSGLQIGYLFFDQGRLVHAELGTLIGEPAVARILSFAAGAFQPSLRAWPARETITCSIESLLLRAAQAIDESRRRNPALSNDATPSNPSVTVSVTRSVGPPSPGVGSGSLLDSPERPAPSRSVPATGVRLDPTGAIVSQRGDQAERLADLVAFAAPLLNVIGNAFGLEQSRGVDVFCSDEKEVLLRSEPDGSWVGAVGMAHELSELRRRLGGV